MPATANANMMALTHAGSSGINMIFPDVCKTPSPAGPIPIPYPNIAQSSDTADGSSTVKVDGNPIMLKSSNYKMSSGDEAGSAMGVVSNKIKGKAEPVNYSFDVKADGKNVFRLTDMMLQNVGNPNTPPGTNLEPPVIGKVLTSKECENTEKEWKKQQEASTSWGECGIISEHREPIQTAASQLKMVLYIRQTKAVCEPWIRAKHQPKPHSCMKGTTIKATDTEKVNSWLRSFFETQGVGDMDIAELSHSGNAAHKRLYMRNPHYYVGIVGMPIRQTMIRPATGAGRQTVSYSGKWMTGDYDLFEVLWFRKGCDKVQGDDFALLKKTINEGCQWDAIQHPPQAQWVPNQHEQAHGVKPCDMNVEVKGCLQPGADRKRKIPVLPPPRTDMAVLDKPLTVVAGKGVMQLADEDKVAEALICQGCNE